MYTFSVFFGDWGLLFLRAVLAAILLNHGLPKLKNLKETASDFSNMGFRPGVFWGTLIALLEPVGGLALLFGSLTTPFAALFTVEFLVIVIWKLSKNAAFVSGWEFDLLILSAVVALLTWGAGTISLDHFWLAGF